MKTIIKSTRIINHTQSKSSITLLICLLFLILPSCQKDENILPAQKSFYLPDSLLTSELSGNPVIREITTVYYGHKIFKRSSGAPFVEIQKIETTNYNCYDGNFVLKIQNGSDKKTRVSSAEIRIDGVLIAGPSDFSKNVSLITKPLSGLTPESILEVKLNSAPGSFIDLWIEGTNTVITPSFTQIDPLLQNSVASELPDTSKNGITGTWSPATINTATAGTFTFTFTPAASQCATTTTMDIEITYMETVSDIEGNSYKTVKIGDQWWMAENLKVTKYRNGDLIGTTTPATLDISGESTPKYQWALNGNESDVSTYGRYYTWYAVTDSRGVCPTGWHVPTDSEWTILTGYLTNNGYGYEGSGADIAKSLASISGWKTDATPGNIGNDQMSNNNSGFTALPGGVRFSTGKFDYIGFYASWWSTSEIITTEVWYRRLYSSQNNMSRANSNKKHGATTRCVRD